MARRPRLAAQAAAVSMRTPIPNISDHEDEEMADVPPTDAHTPRSDHDNEDDEADGDEADEADDVVTPARDSESPFRTGTPRRSGRQTSLLPRRRGGRLGRPRKHPLPSDDENVDATSDVGTPKRRGGFRGHRGGRWARARGGASHATQIPIDREGNTLDVIDDEVVLPGDSEGHSKVDSDGHLKAGREYRVRTFTLIGRGNKLYMLSTEPARCIGFRDSYLFFQKHKMLYKIIIDDEEKRDLIERNLIPHSYKGRAIGVVTARSVFREFGAKIIIGGRKVVDDYDEQTAKERGDIEGELAVPEDHLPAPGEPYNRNQYVAWHGASAVYHTAGPSMPLPSGKMVDGKRKKIAVTSDNWMLEHAREASRFNQSLLLARNEVLDGLYDIQTNHHQWSKITQPTHARWELVDDCSRVQQALSESTAVNGRRKQETTTSLPGVSPVYTRNFRIHDLHLQSAPDSSLSTPGLNIDERSFANIPKSVLDELPPECMQSFREAQQKDLAWRSQWLTEAVDGRRAQFIPTTVWHA